METTNNETPQIFQPMELLAKFATSAEGITNFSRLLVEEVVEGRADPLKVAIALKSMEKSIEIVGQELGAHYVREAGKYGEKPFKIYGADIAVGEVGVKYDFSGCGHPRWEELTQEINSRLTERKQLEDLLKVLKTPTDFIVDGVGCTCKPPTKSGKTGIKITIR